MKRIFYIILLLIFSIPKNVFALTFHEKAIRKNNQLERRNESERRGVIRQEEKNQNDITQKNSLSNFCFLPISIKTKGNKAFSMAFIKEKYLDKYLGKCFSKDDIIRMQKEISEKYAKAGYPDVGIYFDHEEFIQNKTLYLIISESKIHNVRFKNIDEISDKNGDLNISNKKSHPTNVTLSYDNLGQESTGKNQKAIALSQDNLLALNDNIAIKYKRDDAHDDNEKYSKNFSGNISIPYGKWTASAGYSESRFLTTDESNSQSSGTTYTQTYSLDRTFIRTDSYKSKLGAELNLKDRKSYLNDEIVLDNSRQLTTVNIFYDNLFFNDKQSLFLKPSYQKGTNWLGATSDRSSTTSTDPHAQYQELKLYGYYDAKFTVPKTDLPLNYVLTFDSQYSFDTLYGSEQFDIGGPDTVRGFDENSLSGDSGYFLRNDLKVKITDLLTENIKSSKLLASEITKDYSALSALSKTNFAVFYDYGYVRNKYLSEITDEGYMSGAGAKISYEGDNINWDLTYSKSLHSPKFIQNVYGESDDNETIYFKIALKLGLF